MFLIFLFCPAQPVGGCLNREMNGIRKASHRKWSIFCIVRSFFVFLYKEVSVKYILRFPHHRYRSFTFAFG